MTAQITWEGSPPPDREALEAKLRVEIEQLMENGLGHPSDLIAHHVPLSASYTGPSVTLFGREGSDAFFALYAPITEWVSVSEGQPHIRAPRPAGEEG